MKNLTVTMPMSDYEDLKKQAENNKTVEIEWVLDCLNLLDRANNVGRMFSTDVDQIIKSMHKEITSKK